MIGRYGGTDKRRSPRHNRRFMATMEYKGKAHEIRTIDISEYGVLIPKRIPPPIGSCVKLTLTVKGEVYVFEGVVVRHIKRFVNGVESVGVGIDISSNDYRVFVKNNISIDLS
ncbi:MAG TPA: PilZ domain-containing protein [Thermodesulfovibrionales bacterium]|nr:PilZ domain-containing protein [Thermodesulfovibrionales bacterium]